MMWKDILITADYLLLLVLAVSSLYIFFFACANLFYKRKKCISTTKEFNRFLVIFPAYKEDSVIVDSVSTFLRQDYTKTHYDVFVMSDYMSQETNNKLSALPINLIVMNEEKSSKAIALQRAIENASSTYDYIIILDADNITHTDFLSNLNTECQSKHTAYQCHRCSKNSSNEVSQLDSLSEEINNSIFRKGHNAVGLSSALIGSGLCFGFEWFCQHVNKLSTAGEDRELEELLLAERHHILYLEHIPVFDEKVSDAANFQRQRLRWMTAQIQALCRMLHHAPKALFTLNLDYLDKTLQQALIPRSILIVLTFIVAVIHLIFLRTLYSITLLHCISFLMTIFAIFIAIPRSMRNTKLIVHLANTFISLVTKMLANIMKIDRRNTEFIHTTHGQS